MKIATFNVKDFFEARTDLEQPIVERKVAYVAALLRRADADVIALQETASDRLLDELASALLPAGSYRVLAGGRDKRGIGCALLSRLPEISRSIAPSELRRPIPVLEVDGGAAGSIVFLSVHFKSRLPAPQHDEAGNAVIPVTPRQIGEAHVRSLSTRINEALIVREVVDAWLGIGRNVAVLGDFNDTSDSMPVRIVQGAFIGVDPAMQLSRCATPEGAFSILHGGAPDLIDHILVSAGLHAQLTDVTVLSEGLRDHGPHVPNGPLVDDSDHAPIVATFSV